MIEKIKQSKSEKFLIVVISILIILIFYIFVILPNKCLFIKNYDPNEISFSKPEDISILNVECGNVIIELYPDISPGAVKRFKMLVRSGKYDDIAFHRVIKNVLVQTGDLEFGRKNNINYTYIGSGKSGFGTIKSEFNQKFKFEEGTVAMSRLDEKDTEDSQFFILLQDNPSFNGKYTPIGKVIYGLEVLRKIKNNDKSEYVLRPDFINSFKLLLN
ncbi:MAG: peptidylprolyl isomerase [Candidatus Pelagibacter sp. TMED153]|nr:MAG: peptidylprolyl isomerase [Candidatus Pelagibacter sp. TMED153]|tara:strand:- start:2133 stop:2780 length:648 start_codon:yes stop_codon:yes gene_type:complete